MNSGSPVFWFLPPELLIQTCNFNQIIFHFLVSIPPTGHQEHSLPNIVHTKYSWDSQKDMSFGVTITHMSLPPFPIFTHISLFSPSPFLFHAILREVIPSLMHQGGCTWRQESADIIYKHVCSLKKPVLSWADGFTPGLSARNWSHVWPEKKLKDVEPFNSWYLG